MTAGKGTITIDIDNVTPEDTERVRSVIERLILSGSFNVRNGNVTLHFDHEGVLQLIDSHVIRYRRKKA
jgi:hypothetical protein